MTNQVCELAVAIYGFLPEVRRIEAAGISYECRIVLDKIARKQCTLPITKTDYSPVSTTPVDETQEETGDRSQLFDADDEKYAKFLMKLDPNDTKNQDHYKVLGLSKLRWQATMSEIRTCYRQKVLKHHPDKKKHRGEQLPKGEDYFTCITKAYEQLGVNEQLRKAFDSIDHKFDDRVPNDKSVTKENFFTELAPIFVLNARWSTRQPVPVLGNTNSARSDVENFYNFWFDFSTWREFSYLDEEDKERGEDRYERREMEKINKAERERRRKEEVKRIRKLVEMAYAKDPRIVKFKKEEQEAKERAKEERKRIQREKQEAIEKERREAEEAELKKKQEEEARIKAEREAEKKAKEILKKAATEQRRRLKKLADAAGHWTECAREKLEEMERVERVCLMLATDDLKELCDKIEGLSVSDEIRSVIKEADSQKNGKTQKAEVKVEDKGKENEKSMWTNEEIQLLVKAARLYPAGTVDRWLVIADYINEHRKDKTTTPPKNEKQVVKQCKAVQNMAVKLPEATQNQLGSAAIPDEDTWSSQEQKLLEEAIKKHPSSDPERWEKISADIGTKSKKACIRRFKHLVQMVKNKK